ncbi:MAG: CDP-diacylglycerol--glycerol-3-phosphate 3-phosphatidyltransferase [Clostridia bacterium]|nr:CDP-diacylglycerol--glycerol-3-phosphate 3-phosphatidyltransferase [Clostridia bacterium]
MNRHSGTKKLPMNLPNRITLSRIVLVPALLALMMAEGAWCRVAAAAVFAIAATTDFVDGQLARRRKEVTDFGKFMDPIADKMLALLPLIVLCWQRADVSVVAVLIMVAREIIISGFRLVAVGRGSVIAAGRSGKAKTLVQLSAVLLLILRLPYAYYAAWLAAALSAYSGLEILVKNRDILEEAA